MVTVTDAIKSNKRVFYIPEMPFGLLFVGFAHLLNIKLPTTITVRSKSSVVTIVGAFWGTSNVIFSQYQLFLQGKLIKIFWREVVWKLGVFVFDSLSPVIMYGGPLWDVRSTLQ